MNPHALFQIYMAMHPKPVQPELPSWEDFGFSMDGGVSFVHGAAHVQDIDTSTRWVDVTGALVGLGTHRVWLPMTIPGNPTKERVGEILDMYRAEVGEPTYVRVECEEHAYNVIMFDPCKGPS